MYTIINISFATILYVVSISVSFFLSGYTYKYLTKSEIEIEDLKELEMIRMADLYMFSYKYEEDYNDLSMSILSQEQKELLKDTTIIYDVPLNKIIMYYDVNKDTFFYYTKGGDVDYKYLNVVCRKYVIENNCKEIYKDGFEEVEELKQTINIDTCFNRKKKKVENVVQKQHKRINRFIRLGNIVEYYDKKKIIPKRTMTFSSYFSKI